VRIRLLYRDIRHPEDSAVTLLRLDAHAGRLCRAGRARLALAAVALFFSSSASACWDEAAQRYGVNPYLLYAIAKTESNLNPFAINRNNKDGSYDIGIMQINSRWLPTLRKYGIEEAQLWDACFNIHVGAWVLAENMRRMGNSWEAVGAYNARNAGLRIKYARKVYRNIPPEVLSAQR
jgi:soluble lytic murein transglycosylase-like protein